MAAMSSLKLEHGVLVLQTPYDPALVARVKALPFADRKWDAARKVWLIDPRHAAAVAGFAGCAVPSGAAAAPKPETRLLIIEYIGATKDRGDGAERTAFGYSAGAWSVIFPESVLKQWFGLGNVPTDGPTLYSVLGLQASAPADELKTAYRRLARQWHPDVCHEPEAKEQFIAIKHAYDVLSEPNQRAKYDAGLRLAASLKTPQAPAWQAEYRAPLRCGLLTAEGRPALGRFIVAKILTWDDITDSFGRVMVTSWPAGAEKPVVTWA